jgi:hypothetical protein
VAFLVNPPQDQVCTGQNQAQD